MTGVTPPCSHIPNLDAGVLECAVREQEIDGESLLLLTQVSPRRIQSVSVFCGFAGTPEVKKLKYFPFFCKISKH